LPSSPLIDELSKSSSVFIIAIFVSEACGISTAWAWKNCSTMCCFSMTAFMKSDTCSWGMPLSITVLHATGGGSGVNVLDSWDAAGGTEGDGGGAAGALAKGADARVA
jgi:hypothetical protein